MHPPLAWGAAAASPQTHLEGSIPSASAVHNNHIFKHFERAQGLLSIIQLAEKTG
jgi:hypothetical protein